MTQQTIPFIKAFLPVNDLEPDMIFRIGDAAYKVWNINKNKLGVVINAKDLKNDAFVSIDIDPESEVWTSIPDV